MTQICLYREFDYFYCPITGELVLHPEGYNTPPTLLFIYVDEIQGYEYFSENLKEKFPVQFGDFGETIDGEKHFGNMKKDLEWAEDKLLVTYGTIGPATLCFDLGYDK